MKITYTKGHYSLDVDGKDFNELSYDEQKEICHKLVDKINENMLERFVEICCGGMGEYKDLGYCETCGEYIEEYTIEM